MPFLTPNSSEHLRRLKTGQTPGGRQVTAPSSSSKFLSDKIHLKAYDDAILNLEIQKINSKGGLKKKVEVIGELPNGGISYSLKGTKNLTQSNTQTYMAIFRLNSDNLTYRLVTLFPK